MGHIKKTKTADDLVLLVIPIQYELYITVEGS